MIRLAAAALSVAAAALAVAQDGQTPPIPRGIVQPAPPPPAPPAPAPAFPPQPAAAAPNRPGFLHQLKVWWDQSVAGFDTKVKDASGTFADVNKKTGEAAKSAATATTDVMKNAVEATKDAAGAIVRLPNTRVVEMHARCEKAPNGAPDCPMAATNACRSKGFSSGKPLDVSSAEACPPETMLSGQRPAEGQCPTETVILRAICQ